MVNKYVEAEIRICNRQFILERYPRKQKWNSDLKNGNRGKKESRSKGKLGAGFNSGQLVLDPMGTTWGTVKCVATLCTHGRGDYFSLVPVPHWPSEASLEKTPTLLQAYICA